jgi:hypothetical protein
MATTKEAKGSIFRVPQRMKKAIGILVATATAAGCAPNPTQPPIGSTDIPGSQTSAYTETIPSTMPPIPGETPTPTATETPQPAWQTTMETQDPQAWFFRVVDGAPVIDPYETPAAESIVLSQETVKITTTSDGLNPDILTAQDTDGNKYAFNPDHGWFALPDVQMDYAKLAQYTEVDQTFIEDGRANITTALLYAENPTISPDAIDPVYWVSYHWTDKTSGDRVPMLCNNACGLGFEAAQANYSEERARMYYDATTKPFAWTGFYKVHLDSGETVYVVSRTLKNSSETNPNQTINLFYGFDQQHYESMANYILLTGGTALQGLLNGTDKGTCDLAFILSPPTKIDGVDTPFRLSPNDWITGGNPVVAGLQRRGELISELDPDNLQIMMQILHSIGIRGIYDYIAPLTDPLPAGFSTHILLAGFKNR